MLRRAIRSGPLFGRSYADGVDGAARPVRVAGLTEADTAARHVSRRLVEAACSRLWLREPVPFATHFSLDFSRCTEYPYTFDIPAIEPTRSGLYCVVWCREPRSPEWAPAETADPYEAADVVVAHLADDIGPAVPGTAYDLGARVRH
ncbi:DUF6193 family natural product biosynthesis protein [Yinghuangia soli]|uniref:DUF6193 family natural product biosynthesis protein n=1 Tax=Yinghuangia soli TaxID=2908204 RepID=UPI00355766BD